MRDSQEENFIQWFKDIRLSDVANVGGKNAALGEMYANLTPLGIRVPNGFAITALGYRHFLKASGIEKRLQEILAGLNTRNISHLQKAGQAARELILRSSLPETLRERVCQAYQTLGTNADVAVRSSATAEDLPGASFAGQQETYLNVAGAEKVLEAVKKCFASLFTDRAISYRADKGFSHFEVDLSVGIQRMVRSDLASSGVAFTIDTETGFDQVVVINGVYGLGEMIVQGEVKPDEFIVFKPTLRQGFRAIISKNLGRKNIKLVYADRGTRRVRVLEKDQAKFCLDESEILALAEWCVKLEEYFSKKYGRHQALDIEWAKDGKTKEMFIVQARPETVHSTADKNLYREYRMRQSGKLVLTGVAVGTKIASGRASVIRDPSQIKLFRKGEILVTEITDPDWEPIMKIASAILTDKGGRTSHAAIVSRELGIPCVVGTERATKVLGSVKEFTVDCSSGETGKIYAGKLKFEVLEHRLDRIPETKTRIMLNIGSPDEAFKNHFLPVKGVGLGRLEFIIASHVQIHPNALIEYPKLKKFSLKQSSLKALVRKIEELTIGYRDKTQFYVDELAEGIARISAAFWPHAVIIRFSDFKTNEYRKLLGGERYEPAEENPMLGWRGASRYYHPAFRKAFGLECLAMRKVREEMGLKNLLPMIPFCRTTEEGKAVVERMREYGLDRTKDPSLKIYVMCEIPSNILSVDAFLDVFDGMSIGSNDLAQLTLGLDRDSDRVSQIANENDPAVKQLIQQVIRRCLERKKYIGICGQAPSDYPEFAEFLVREGIESISLNPDSVVKTILNIHQKENMIS